jgi:hypothetical protein
MSSGSTTQAEQLAALAAMVHELRKEVALLAKTITSLCDDSSETSPADQDR